MMSDGIRVRRLRDDGIGISHGRSENVIDIEAAVSLISQLQRAINAGDVTHRKPSGIVARCQCGVIVGAADYDRTDRQELGRIAGQWLADGCTIEPKLSYSWECVVSPCRCKREQS